MPKAAIDLRWPITDAFGTRFSPGYLLDGLTRVLRADFRLVLDDEGAILQVRAKDRVGPRLEPAMVWLRDRLVGLSVRVETASIPSGAPGVRDQRRIPILTVALAEFGPGSAGYTPAIARLLERLGLSRVRARKSKGGSGGVFPGVPDEFSGFARTLSEVLPDFGIKSGGVVLRALDGSGNIAGTGGTGKGPFFLVWRRKGGSPGVFAAVALGSEEIRWLVSELQEFPGPGAPDLEVLLDGLEWGVFRRPTVAAWSDRGEDIVVDPDRCTDCGLCAQLCPVDYLGKGKTPKPDPKKSCIRCADCVEACPEDALRPAYNQSSAMRGSAVRTRPGWLSRLRGCAGPALPATHPPSYLLAKPKASKKPRFVLGLAVATMQEHAAALLKDGKLVGAVEEEKLVRIRHYGWPPKDLSPFGFPIEESFCRRSIRGLLSKEGITLDDVDVIAVNGLPARYGMAIVNAPPERPLPIMRSGRLMFIPHHLSHAASAYRLSGLKDAWVLTVDGRGERQTAAVFKASRGSIKQVYELLSLIWRSIGGVYESVTRLLGFGSHGQGSVMALAGFGRPTVPLGRYLSWLGPNDIRISETVFEDLQRLARAEDSPVRSADRDLAASLQKALEDTVLNILKEYVPLRPDGLCLAGGVALNCRLNELIRRHFKPKAMFVQPGANDAGTALGAALEACSRLDSQLKPFPMEHAYLGPGFDDEEIAAELEHSGLSYRRSKDVCGEAARLLAAGKVLAWFQGRVEFGPRALGARSILADPRRPGTKDKVNKIKARESWRPFGPSILAGREKDWFERPFDSRFMLFTVPVKKDKAAAIPAVLHTDGTTRPQAVHKDVSPLYHKLITAFERLTKVPMVLNTSFTRKGEPIVCTPKDAVESFRGLGIDALVMGPFIVVDKPRTLAKPGALRRLKGLPGGRRLALRVTTECDLECAHCTMRDIRGRRPRSLAEAVRAVEKGRRARCDELVLMRGEPALWPHLPALSAAARKMGYKFIQVQTNGRPFSRPGERERLLIAVDAAEVVVLGADEATHDGISGVPGSFKEMLMGTKVLLEAGKHVLSSVAVQRKNLRRLETVPALLYRFGVRHIQFNFPRPVEMPRSVVMEPLARLSDVSGAVRRARRAALALGMEVSTEGIPYCHLDQDARERTESAGAWDRFRVDDLEFIHDKFGSQLRGGRPEPPVCRGCSARRDCPRTWSLYLEIFGSSELRALGD